MKGGQERGAGLVLSEDKCPIICLECRLKQDHAELHGHRKDSGIQKALGIQPIRVYRRCTRIVIQNGHSGFNVETGL